MYLISLGAGVLVGIIYALMQVRSPAPPAVALLGLLGMLVGEQMVPIAKRVIQGQPLSKAWIIGTCVPSITGVKQGGSIAASAEHSAGQANQADTQGRSRS